MTHLSVESATVATAISLALRPGILSPAGLAVLAWYNGLAFISQPLLGLLVDLAAARWRTAHRWVAMAGCSLAAAAPLLTASAPTLALVAAAVGNALFHVGTGALVLAHWPRSAGAQGLFVGPGDLGIVVGLFVARGVWPECGAWFGLASLAAMVPLWAMPEPGGMPLPTARRVQGRGLALALLLVAVACRPATVGWLAAGANGRVGLLLVLYGVAAAAKCAGGIAADRWGWRRTLVAAGLLTAVLAPFSRAGVAPLMAAAALAQVPTGVTLAGIGRWLPALPAAAFGLTTLVVYLGGPPAVPRLPSAGWAVAAQVLAVWCCWSALAPQSRRCGERC